MGEPIKILLVDDQRLLREGLRILLELEFDLKVVGEAKDGQAALEAYPDYAEPQRALGALYWKLGRLRASKAAYRAYLKLRPGDRGARRELRQLRKRLRENDRN